MPQLNIHLLGNLRVSIDDQPPLDLGAPKTRALFAYLVLNHQQSIDRRRLAFLFWPRGTEVAARRNLRQYLHRIRKALEPVDPNGRFLSTEGHYIQFQPPNNWFFDVAAFEQASSSPTPDLAHATSLYTGDLLAEMYDEWIVPERDRLARLYRQNLLQLAEQCEAAGQINNAIKYTEQYLVAEPYLESCYLRLMRLYYTIGNRGRVQQLYDQLETTLQEELATAPLLETQTAYKSMLAGSYDTLAKTAVSAKPTLAIPETPTSPSQKSEPPFIGKEAELDHLNSIFKSTVAAKGTFLLISGEAGIGKTRLIDVWLNQIKTGSKNTPFILKGRAHEFESMIPYSPLMQALQQVAHRIPWELFRPAPAWLASLRPFLPNLNSHLGNQPINWPDHAGQHHVIESLGNLFLTLARQQPIILFVDNLHWADSPTWTFLGYLAQRAIHARILIISTARSEDLSADRQRLLRKLNREQLCQESSLNRLSKNETEQLINQLAQADKGLNQTKPDPLFVNRVFEETEGNPFFIVETIRAVQETDKDWTHSIPTDATGNRPAFAIPLQIQSVIESRLDKLSEESRTALGVAAAIGREFTFSLLQEVSQYSTDLLLDALDKWLARGLVRETLNGYDFTHEKLSHVAYEHLSRARRQWIHFQVAEHLQQEGIDTEPAQLAHHYYLSNKPAKALPFLAQAGQRALTVHSYPEAREFGLKAIGLLGRFPSITQTNKTERIDLNLQLAQAYAFTGALKKSLQLLQETERVAESLGDMERLAYIFYRSSQIFWLRGHIETANKYASRTLRHAEELDDANLRFAALRMQGRASILLGDFDNAISYFLRYVDLAEKSQRYGLPVVYGYLGVAYARVGSWQRAIDAAQKGVTQANIDLPGSIHVVARMQLAFVHAELREWEQALKIAEPDKNLWREDGITPHLFMLRAVIGRSLTFVGKTEQGLTELQEALKWAEDVDYRVLVHVVWLFLAQAQYQAGQFMVGMETAVSATTLAAKTGDRWAEAVALRTQAEIGMRLSKPDWIIIESNLIQARDILRQIRARPDLARTYLTLRRLYDRAGQLAWAVDCHFRAITIFEELGMEDEHRRAQGQAGGERTGAVVIPGLKLRGPNLPIGDSDGVR
ncbi:MAG: AAA family ATPase [Chloroflexi bacterium]|nr:AAA family ATPase [Chloroflexota bacterium]